MLRLVTFKKAVSIGIEFIIQMILQLGMMPVILQWTHEEFYL